jgi:hypothetical protein
MATKKKTATTTPTPKPPTKKTATTTPAVPAAPAAPAVTGSQDAYDTFLPIAQAIPKAAVVGLNADPSLAFHNVDAGVAPVLAEKTRLAKELPTVDVAELASLPSLALAVAFAALQVDRDRKSDGAIAAKLAEAHPLRRKLLSSASALADAGVIAAADVAKIQKGTGHLDAAGDLVALSALFAKHAKAIAGKSPIATADVKRAGALGSELLATLKPASAKARGARPGAEAAETRDRLWTLLVERHDRLRRVGMWLFGEREVDARVPALLAHVAAKGAGRKAKTATTTPGSAATAGK